MDELFVGDVLAARRITRYLQSRSRLRRSRYIPRCQRLRSRPILSCDKTLVQRHQFGLEEMDF
jgi:hypothetical protein